MTPKKTKSNDIISYHITDIIINFMEVINVKYGVGVGGVKYGYGGTEY